MCIQRANYAAVNCLKVIHFIAFHCDMVIFCDKRTLKRVCKYFTLLKMWSNTMLPDLVRWELQHYFELLILLNLDEKSP